MRKSILLLVFLLAGYALFSQRGELKNPLLNSKDVIADAVALHDKGKYKEAITEYLKIPVSDTNYSQALNEMALSYYSDSNYVEAEKCVNSGMELFPGKKASWLRLLADIYDDTKRTNEALNVYDTIIRMNPYDYLAYFNKGICLYRQERLDEALPCFQKCVMLNPYYSSGHYFLGVISMLKGNMVQAMLSFTTDLIVRPGNRYLQKTITHLSSISTVNNTVTELLKKYKPSKEDDFEQVQEILLSKAALDKKYKLKVDLEDQIVRQIQVVMEKLEYNEQDKGFWMQYYVPAFKKMWDDKKIEPFVFYMFSELSLDKVKDYVKKEKKAIDNMSSDLVTYYNLLRKSQEIMYPKREGTKMMYYISDYVVTGKGEFGKNEKGEDLLVGPWEFYYTTGGLKSKGVFDSKGSRTGEWRYYYEDGNLKEVSSFKLDKAEGKSESWHDNGLRYIISNYKDDVPDGVETMYYYNGQLRSAITYKAGKKEGIAKYYTVNGILNAISNYINDQKEGEETTYYEDGKVASRTLYSKDEPTGEYKEYHENGKLLKTGSFTDGKYSGPWKWFFDNGQPQYVCSYIEGELDGEYLSYYRNGKMENRSFYKKGNVDGKKEDYDDDGFLFCETIFEKGRLRDIKFFDKKGNVISNTSSRRGNADIVFYDPDGYKVRDGYFTKEGLQEGKGTYYFKNGKVQTALNYKNGVQEGKKTIYYANGGISQEGNFSNDEANGYFLTYYVNGTVSEEGWYVNGQRQGTFYYYNPLGQLSSKLYYLNDKVHGVAEYYQPNGKPSYTEYYDNAWFKKIVQFDSTGNVLSASELNKGEGKVLFKHHNGKPYIESNYRNYKLHGSYKISNADGTVASTSFYKNGDIDSTYRSWYNNGKVQTEGRYSDGKKTGDWKYYYRDGVVSETEKYVDGKIDGKNTQYNEDGSLGKEIEFKEGNLNGPYKFYGENKQLAVVLYYKDDVLTGYSYEDKSGNLVPVIPITGGTGKVIAWFKNGNKSVQMQYNESFVEGDRFLYYSNGKEFVTGKRINGYDNGTKKIYYSNGKLMKEENYVNGTLHGPFRYYNENGSLNAELNYYNGDLHGVCKYYEAGKLAETLVYHYGMLEAKK